MTRREALAVPLLALPLLLALALALVAARARAAVAPPRWADPARNPCAAQPGGWQLLQWPPDGRCYRIFTVGAPGPCPPTQELAPHARTGAATCRCPPGTAQLRSAAAAPPHHAPCHALFRRGPCPRAHYLAPLPRHPDLPDDEDRRVGECVAAQRCEEGQLFWPPTRRCYEALTRGPCPRGELLAPPALPPNGTAPAQEQREEEEEGRGEEENGVDEEAEEDGLARCACEPRGALASHFWAAGAGAGGGGGGVGGGGACYEHFTRGPCLESGHLFLPGATCGCHRGLPHFHEPTGQCYPLGSAGPCAAGRRFEAAPGEARARCRCRPGHVPWAAEGGGRGEDDGSAPCHRLYTRGPCPEGQFLLDRATCAALCRRGRLYFPERNTCYRVGLRGPCPKGQVVVFEAAARPSADGVSYRGACGCPDGGARDCPSAAPSAPSLEQCDAKAGLVRWNGTCHALYSRGPCAQHQWLVPAREGRLLWDEAGWRRRQSAARCDCRPGYAPLRGPAHAHAHAHAHAQGDGDGAQLQCLPPAVSLADFLNRKYRPDADAPPDQWW